MKIKSKGISKGRAATAYHEAGHAVAHYVLKSPFKYVTIQPDEEQHSLGHVRSMPKPDSFQPDIDTGSSVRQRIEKEVMCYFAGGVAEKRFTGRANQKGSSTDFRHAVDLASYVASEDKELEAYLNWLHRRTENLIAAPWIWALVKAMAEALLKQHTIKQKQARQILRTAEQEFFAFKPVTSAGRPK